MPLASNRRISEALQAREAERSESLDAPGLLLVFALGILAIVILISKFKVHPFLTIFVVTIAVGLAYGFAPRDLIQLIIKGFSNILGYVAIIVLSATIIGEILDRTGATRRVAEAVLMTVGSSRTALAMGVSGYLVALPVMCCDTAFIVLSPIARALAGAGKVSKAAVSTALAVGAYTSFKLVYPAGPLFTSAILGAEIGKVMELGVLASIPVFALGLLWAHKAERASSEPVSTSTIVGSADSRLPSTLASFACIVLPISLILLRSMVGTTLSIPVHIRQTLDLVGHPIIALPIGVGLSLTLASGRKMSEINVWISDGIKRAASILAIVGAGGALGTVLQASRIGDVLGDAVASLGVPGLAVVFLVSAVIKTGIGSSMVTWITAPSIILPILPALGVSPVMASLAICAGSMVCINVNDSFFWVVTGFADMDIRSGFKNLTLLSTLMGTTALVTIVLLGSLFT